MARFFYILDFFLIRIYESQYLKIQRINFFLLLKKLQRFFITPKKNALPL